MNAPPTGAKPHVSSLNIPKYPLLSLNIPYAKVHHPLYALRLSGISRCCSQGTSEASCQEGKDYVRTASSVSNVRRDLYREGRFPVAPLEHHAGPQGATRQLHDDTKVPSTCLATMLRAAQSRPASHAARQSGVLHGIGRYHQRSARRIFRHETGHLQQDLLHPARP